MHNNLDILVVDDSRFFAEGMEEILKEEGLKAASLTDSTRAIDYIKKEKPQFVLTDIMMPSVDGFNLCRMIKSDDELKDIRVVMFSSKGFTADRERAYQAGVEAFIEKSEALDLLAQHIIKLFNEPVTIKFWGTRGSIPVPGPDTIKYGGNTPCVEVRPGGKSIIIFDAGTGIRALGDDLIKRGETVRAHIFFTHFHWDHIQGFPFFAPANVPENHINFYGYEDRESKLGKVISDQMESVYYPVPITRLGASIQFRPLAAERAYQIENFNIKTIYLNHPGNTMGYLLSHRNKKIAYLTDNELATGKTPGEQKTRKIEDMEYNQKVINFSRGADILIIDAQYTRDEYNEKRGWGHSRYQDTLEVGLAAGVKRLALFHHDPTRSDKKMDRIVSECK
ncbi:MAG: response regulator, partial [Thermodesulfobacteriota bacterium]|nr:response regulator [Thermodesulfobacteriota bacterium]